MTIIKKTLIIINTLAMFWVLPWVWNLVTDKPSRFPFVYYSSIVEAFGIRHMNGDDFVNTDSNGNIYSTDAFDSILPMLYYRQLANNGRLPDSLNGRAISPHIISTHNFFFRYRPSDQFKPQIALYPLFESMAPRVDIEMPGDVFRLTETLSFIDPVTNKVKEKKSQLFNQSLLQQGFVGPAKHVAGTPSTRKAYDEGYFIIDANQNLFHLKMVNAKPFVRKITVNEEIQPLWIATTEYPDRSFYGFLFTKDNRLFTINTHGYDIQEVPMPEFDYKKDELLIMANMFFWNVQVTSQQGMKVFALDANSRQKADQIYFERTHASTMATKWFVPVALKFTSSDDEYIIPRAHAGGWQVIPLSIVLLLTYILICRKRGKKVEVLPLFWIAVTGLAGFTSILLFNS
jgi:hypothetical protein